MIDLRLQILREVITQPLSQERADNGSRPADECCRDDGSSDSSAGNDDCACSNGCACIHKAPHYAALSVPDGLRRDICVSRDNRIVFDGAHVRKAAAELFIRRLFTGEQTQIGPVEAGTQEFVDRRLKIIRAPKDADCFANSAWLLAHGKFFR